MLRIIDDETIWIPNRVSCRKEIDFSKYVEVEKNIFKLCTHQKLFFVRTWLGLGDCIYQRPFILELQKIYKENLVLKTAWPELFKGITCTRPRDILKVQSDNANKNNLIKTHYRMNIKLGYHTPDLLNMTMMEGIEKHNFKLDNFNFDLKIEDSWYAEAKKLGLPPETVILYWPTLRYDWHCPERNPDTKYFQHLVDKFKDRYYVIIGYLRDVEKYEQEPRNVQARYENGELHYTTILALLKLYPALTRPSFPLPASIAVGGRSLCLFGGHFPPSVLVDTRMNLTNFKYCSPVPFTNWKCKSVNKVLDVEDLEEKFEWLISGGM